MAHPMLEPSRRRPRLRTWLLAALVSVGLAGAVLVGAASAPGPPTVARGELRWLARVTFGLDSAAVARFRLLGREKFLDEQLHPPADDPPALASQLEAIPAVTRSA